MYILTEPEFVTTTSYSISKALFDLDNNQLKMEIKDLDEDGETLQTREFSYPIYDSLGILLEPPDWDETTTMPELYILVQKVFYGWLKTAPCSLSAGTIQ